MGAGVAGICVLAWLVLLSIYDIRERRLPNWLTLPGAAAVMLGACLAGRGAPAVLGAVALLGAYLLVHLVAPAAMGAGDVKLAIGIGGLTGAFGIDVWSLAALGAPLLTAVWGLIASIKRTERTVPHGPSMCLTTAAAMALAILGSRSCILTVG